MLIPFHLKKRHIGSVLVDLLGDLVIDDYAVTAEYSQLSLPEQKSAERYYRHVR